MRRKNKVQKQIFRLHLLIFKKHFTQPLAKWAFAISQTYRKIVKKQLLNYETVRKWPACQQLYFIRYYIYV